MAILVTAASLAAAAGFLYRRKEACQEPDGKAVKLEDGPDSQKTSEENRKEYFI